MDELDGRLAEARPTVADDDAVRAALADVVSARVKRRRFVLPVMVATGVIALGGVGAAYAAGAFDWNQITDPDYSIARDWYDVEGNYLGSCESRIDVYLLDEQVRPVVENWFATHDVDSYEPRPETVAAALYFRGDPERMPQILAGETVDAYLDGIQGRPGSSPPEFRRITSDAYILHMALNRTIDWEITQAIFGAEPELGSISASGELHCTTDPDYEG